MLHVSFAHRLSTTRSLHWCQTQGEVVREVTLVNESLKCFHFNTCIVEICCTYLNENRFTFGFQLFFFENEWEVLDSFHSQYSKQTF